MAPQPPSNELVQHVSKPTEPDPDPSFPPPGDAALFDADAKDSSTVVDDGDTIELEMSSSPSNSGSSPYRDSSEMRMFWLGSHADRSKGLYEERTNVWVGERIGFSESTVPLHSPVWGRRPLKEPTEDVWGSEEIPGYRIDLGFEPMTQKFFTRIADGERVVGKCEACRVLCRPCGWECPSLR